MKCQFFFLSYADEILIVCKCIEIKFLNIYFINFLRSLPSRYTGQFFWRNNSLCTVQFSLRNLQVSWRSWFSRFNSKWYFIWLRLKTSSTIFPQKQNNRKEFTCHKLSLNLLKINFSWWLNDLREEYVSMLLLTRHKNDLSLLSFFYLILISLWVAK